MTRGDARLHGRLIADNIQIAPGTESYLDVRCAARKNEASVLRVASAWKIGANAAITGMRRRGSSGAPTSPLVLISTPKSTEICQDI